MTVFTLHVDRLTIISSSKSGTTAFNIKLIRKLLIN